MSLGLSLDKSCLEDLQHLPQGGLCSLHASSDTWLCCLLWSPSVGGFSYSPWSGGEQAGGVPREAALQLESDISSGSGHWQPKAFATDNS